MSRHLESRLTQCCCAGILLLLAFSKPMPSGSSDLPLYRFEAEGELIAAPGQFKDTVYLGSQDANVYAIDMAGAA